MKPIRYAIHPGFVYGNLVLHGYGKLIKLYGVHPSQCILWDDDVPDTYRGRRTDDYIHLYTRHRNDHKEILKVLLDKLKGENK